MGKVIWKIKHYLFYGTIAYTLYALVSVIYFIKETYENIYPKPKH